MTQLAPSYFYFATRSLSNPDSRVKEKRSIYRPEPPRNFPSPTPELLYPSRTPSEDPNLGTPPPLPANFGLPNEEQARVFAHPLNPPYVDNLHNQLYEDIFGFPPPPRRYNLRPRHLINKPYRRPVVALIGAITAHVSTSVAQELIQANARAGRGDPAKKGAADPGKYDGSISRFEEWWSKMKAYLQLANFAATSQDCFAVWTRLEGPVAGAYARARIDACRASGVYPDMAALEAEIEAKFRPINNKDWAKAQLQKIRQGGTRTEEFVAKFGALAMSAGASDDYAIFMLERAMRPDILQQIFVQGRRKPDLAGYVTELRAVGGALEAARMHTSSRFAFPSSSSRPSPSTGTFGGSGIPMEIGAASNSRPVPSHIKCFSCGGNHFKRDCTSRSQQQRSRFPPQPRTPFSPQPAARQAETQEDPQLRQLQGMSFEEMQAFFYDKQVNEMKAQGKGFGQ
ncbi:hypothetical protein PISMIDRAFT_11842 [Pisolithus microcarpus 441]|uniref:Retrotransposon gag domain-containing protein n=1 Tax=Pisolithus microcarpus 441 TaxID=765257 RepID=A0A0C9Z7X9_9AGAM|nr:hypothetical protein PISMIDRAFT_11842 [Pisolithus microcarpus 441]